MNFSHSVWWDRISLCALQCSVRVLRMSPIPAHHQNTLLPMLNSCVVLHSLSRKALWEWYQKYSASDEEDCLEVKWCCYCFYSTQLTIFIFCFFCQVSGKERNTYKKGHERNVNPWCRECTRSSLCNRKPILSFFFPHTLFFSAPRCEFLCI